MNAGRDYQKAREWAQGIASAARAPRWLHKWGGVWWIDQNPSYGSERIDPE